MLSIYLAVSAFLGIFTVIYYQFSHGVTSPYMTFVFLIPLVLGGIACLVRHRFGEGGYVARNAYPSGIAAITVASLLQGVFLIAGNSSKLVMPLAIVGIVLLITGIIAYAVDQNRCRSK